MNRKLSLRVLTVGLSGTLMCMPAAFAAMDAPPGQWTFTTSVHPPKLPFGLSIPPNLPLPRSGTRSVCITEADIQEPGAIVRQQTGCRLDRFEEVKNHIQWTASCQGPPRSLSSGSLAMEGASMAGTAVVKTDLQGFELPVSVSYRGQRTGPCSQEREGP